MRELIYITTFFSRYIPVHDIVKTLGPSRSKALPAFHALTGCDTTSAFFGKGKKSAWAVWQSLPELTLPLELFSSPNPTQEVISNHTSVLHRLVLLLYGVTKENITTVDAARHFLFLHQGRDFEHMPPSSDALHQHLLRVAYQVNKNISIGSLTMPNSVEIIIIA